MNYNSFYGGRQGTSFIISKSYNSIQEMVNEFKLGTNFSEVKFNEYVFINAGVSHEDNGKMFRRGYDYNNDMGGAVYVGKVTGSPGSAAALTLTNIEKINEIINQVDLPEDSYGTGLYLPDKDIVPGKYITQDGAIAYNDNIEWAYCSMEKEDGTGAVAYLGFKMPYPIVEFTAGLVDVDKAPQDYVERVDDETHPFYSKWKISIPKGMKGDLVKNLRSMKATSAIQEYPGQADDIANQREVLVYDYYHYDNDLNGDPVSIYLGDYNMIDSISVAADGSLICNYTHKDNMVLDKIFKWVKSITLSQTGHFTVEYNHALDANGSPTKYETDLKWVSNVSVSSTGIIMLTYPDGSTKTLSNKIKWINGVSINTGSVEGEGNQKIKINYNDNTSSEVGNPINYIMKAAVSDRGHLLILYSDPARRAEIKTQGKNYTWDGRDDWYNLGIIKSGSGILIGLNLNTSDYPDTATQIGAINYLNSTYPNGLTGVDLEGKIVTVGDENGNKSFYAFDYLRNVWFYVGDLGSGGSGGVGVIVGAEGDTETEILANQLPAGGAWFILEEE